MTHELPQSTPSTHDHGPVPSYEWVVNGDCSIVLPHLRTFAPTLAFDGRHFDIAEMDREAQQLPVLFMIVVQDVSVGGIDFLPLPSNRTLMRLYLCSDLGAACQLENGDAVATGFVEVWLTRLQQLEFITSVTPAGPAIPAAPAVRRRLGFATPEH